MDEFLTLAALIVFAMTTTTRAGMTSTSQI
jgi:hypothetical protein